MNKETLIGSLLGTAVGDAIGLPYEGLGAKRAAKLLGPPDKHRFFFGRGMVSDDTEHACFTAQALLLSDGNPDLFLQALSRSLRWWMIGMPAGIGFATLRAIFKLWLGFSPSKSGVFSAGNGPAMRSPIIGVAYGHDQPLMTELVRRSTRITHSDPKAFHGALAAAAAAFLGSCSQTVSPDNYLEFVSSLQDMGDGEECLELLNLACRSAEGGESLQTFMETLGCPDGISGYMFHTMPAVIHVWLRHQHDFPSAVREIVAHGGDTDTTAAILGGILGA